ncbi:hypothetical protein CFP56_006517 [Quercus suber]|uniref:Uncharacterized protein n=1 Tax=Quercus suber TaxID=58331 RepID=A0AAW0L7J8_QUESU
MMSRKRLLQIPHMPILTS